MFKHLLLAITFGLMMQSCNKKTSGEESMPAIKKVFDSYYQERLPLYPLEATMNGDSRYNDRMSDELTRAGKEKLVAFYKKYQTELTKYDREKLSAEEKVSWDLLNWECAINLEGLSFPVELMPLNQIFSTHLMIAQIAGGTSLFYGPGSFYIPAEFKAY